jgi:hypothetical protein
MKNFCQDSFDLDLVICEYKAEYQKLHHIFDLKKLSSIKWDTMIESGDFRQPVMDYLNVLSNIHLKEFGKTTTFWSLVQTMQMFCVMTNLDKDILC